MRTPLPTLSPSTALFRSDRDGGSSCSRLSRFCKWGRSAQWSGLDGPGSAGPAGDSGQRSSRHVSDAGIRATATRGARLRAAATRGARLRAARTAVADAAASAAANVSGANGQPPGGDLASELRAEADALAATPAGKL